MGEERPCLGCLGGSKFRVRPLHLRLLASPMRASCTFDLSTPAQRGQFRFSLLPPEGDGEAQRCQVTHPKVTQQIDSRVQCWPAGPGQAAFHSQGQFGHLVLPRARQSRVVLGAPRNKGRSPAQEVGSDWGGLLASADTWRKGLSPPALLLPSRGMSFPESRAPRQAFPQSVGQKARS